MAESHPRAPQASVPPPPLCSLGLQPHPQVQLCLGGDEGKGDKSVVQHLHWSKSRGPAPRVPPPPPARDGGGKCGCQSLQPCHPAQSCAVSHQSSKLPGARGEGLCRLLPSPCGDDPVFMPLSATTKQLGPGWLGYQRRGGAPRVWSRWAAVCAEGGLPSTCDPLKEDTVPGPSFPCRASTCRSTDSSRTAGDTGGTFDPAPRKFCASYIRHPHRLWHPRLCLGRAMPHHPHFTGEETEARGEAGHLPTVTFPASSGPELTPSSLSLPAGSALLPAYLPS